MDAVLVATIDISVKDKVMIYLNVIAEDGPAPVQSLGGDDVVVDPKRHVDVPGVVAPTGH